MLCEFVLDGLIYNGRYVNCTHGRKVTEKDWEEARDSECILFDFAWGYKVVCCTGYLCTF